MGGRYGKTIPACGCRWNGPRSRDFEQVRAGVLFPSTPDGSSREAPSNCRFEVDDANLGFSHYKSTFDVVHVRCVSAGIKDWHTLLLEMEMTLKPGGVLLTFGTAGLQLYDASKQLIEADDESEQVRDLALCPEFA